MKPRRLILTLALTASFTLQAQNTNAPLSWTSSDGRVMQASFIKLDGEAVVIEKDGKEFVVPLAKLAPASVALAKKLGGVMPVNAPDTSGGGASFDPAGTEPIKPLWVLPTQAFTDPATPDKPFTLDANFPRSTKSGDLIFVLSGADKPPSLGVALVSGKTGKLLWRTDINDRPDGIEEWNRGCSAGPDGHLYQWSVSFHNPGNFKLERALFHLRKLDAATGKILAHLKMSMDNPNSPDEPKGVAWQGGDQDIAVQISAQRVLVATGRFLAEVNLDLSKVVRSTLLPEKWRDFRYSHIPDGGDYAFWNHDADQSLLKVFTLPGEEPQEVPSPKDGWKVANAFPQEGGLHSIIVECQAPDKQSWAAGAYDPEMKTWLWVKTDEQLSKPTAGQSKTLAKISFDGRIDDTAGEKYQGIWVVDADSGDLRYRPPGYDTMKFLDDGRIWVFPSEYEVKKGRAREGLLVNSADGSVETRLPWVTSMSQRGDMLITADGNVLLDSVKQGVVEIEVLSAARKAAFPPRKIALDLPSPPKGVDLRAYGVDGIPAAVLKVTCVDGTTHYCAIPLPK